MDLATLVLPAIVALAIPMFCAYRVFRQLAQKKTAHENRGDPARPG
jgi:Na+/H+ antiporter NhaD/arsenite permease-like protein